MSTPLMEQYHAIKQKHPGDILFFRLGDFYEMFYDDARLASRLLGITLTSRAKGDQRIPMAGVPYHASANYINRLLRAGHKVAICDQMEDPEEAEGAIVDRAVTRVVTPGTLLTEGILEEKKNNYLAAVSIHGEGAGSRAEASAKAGLAWVDLSTGTFFVEEVSVPDLMDELVRLSPSECLLSESLLEQREDLAGRIRAAAGGMITPCPDWNLDLDMAIRSLNEHFGTSTLSGFGFDDHSPSLAPAGAVLAYLKETQRSELRHITGIRKFDRAGRVFLDRQTRSSLELTEVMTTHDRKGSLLWVLDKTLTAMGARMLREWILSPLSQVEEIRHRQDGVRELHQQLHLRQNSQKILKEVPDLERLTARVGTGRANARDLASIRTGLGQLPSVQDAVLGCGSPVLKAVARDLTPLSELQIFLERALVDDPPHVITEGGMIRDGFHGEIDSIRSISRDGKGWIASFQAQEIQRTGISSLKVGFNNVFGYYIEITHVHREKIPADYIRKQTLKNAERYITPQLKDYETQVLNADERLKKLEYEVFQTVRERVASEIPALQRVSRAIAELDALASLAQAAHENNYVVPEVDDSLATRIVAGRHPVLEKVMTEPFVPNDLALDVERGQIMIITGPNMAGKSTYIRQGAIITLMAQIGSLVPAREARIGVVDRIFTRVGASDELLRGASTFMVEMSETANILNNATRRSLIVLDEIGRGTSTFDGVSIAWAVVEFLHNHVGARTLFATHYHELTELASVLERVRNHHCVVREWKDQIVFLRQIQEGASDKSYGIHVARLAGIPREVVERAKVILTELESMNLNGHEEPRLKARAPQKGDLSQLSLFSKSPPPKETVADPLREELRSLDPNALTPLEALHKLAELKRKAEEENPKF